MLVEEVSQSGREKGHIQVCSQNKETKTVGTVSDLENSNNEDQLEGCCIST